MPLRKLKIPKTNKGITISEKGALRGVVKRREKLDEVMNEGDPNWSGGNPDGPIDWSKRKQN